MRAASLHGGGGGGGGGGGRGIPGGPYAHLLSGQRAVAPAPQLPAGGAPVRAVSTHQLARIMRLGAAAERDARGDHRHLGKHPVVLCA